MTHAQGILAQLKVGEDDDDLPKDFRERVRARIDEMEDELEEDD